MRTSAAASSTVRTLGAVSHVSGTLAFFKFAVSVAALSAGAANGFESRLESLVSGSRSVVYETTSLKVPLEFLYLASLISR